ncbi:hypothetical protein [Actinokineospora sp. NPDC004072]
MSSGFALSLDDLDTLANSDLPELAGLMAAPISALAGFASFGPIGDSAESAGTHEVYAAHVELLTTRQRRLYAAIDETAEALREIITLYRRADGQG